MDIERLVSEMTDGAIGYQKAANLLQDVAVSGFRGHFAMHVTPEELGVAVAVLLRQCTDKRRFDAFLRAYTAAYRRLQ